MKDDFDCDNCGELTDEVFSKDGHDFVCDLCFEDLEETINE